MCQTVGNRMLAAARGAIINMASQAATVALDQHVAYCASKFGVVGLSKVLAAEWAGRGVRVNTRDAENFYWSRRHFSACMMRRWRQVAVIYDLSDLPNASWALKTQIFDGDVLFLEWAADSAATHAEDGVDTFVFRDGLIRAQTARYSARDKG